MWSEFSVPATKGYHVRVSADGGTRKMRPTIYVEASKGHESVNYVTHGRVGSNGVLDVKLPKIGRIAVRFKPKKVTRQALADNCKGRATVVRHGTFRGIIVLHGEQEYTELHRYEAVGTVSRSFRQICRQSEVGRQSPHASARLTYLLAGAKDGRQSLGFTAIKTDLGTKFGTSTSFMAYSQTKREGLQVLSQITVEGKASGLSTSGPLESFEDATVEPPDPFGGSAAFHLDSPTTSTWTGTLNVDLPGIGRVVLAGDRFWSALCGEDVCTKTLPPNVRVVVQSAFRS